MSASIPNGGEARRSRPGCCAPTRLSPRPRLAPTTAAPAACPSLPPSQRTAPGVQSCTSESLQMKGKDRGKPRGLAPREPGPVGAGSARERQRPSVCGGHGRREQEGPLPGQRGAGASAGPTARCPNPSRNLGRGEEVPQEVGREDRTRLGLLCCWRGAGRRAEEPGPGWGAGPPCPLSAGVMPCLCVVLGASCPPPRRMPD